MFSMLEPVKLCFIWTDFTQTFEQGPGDMTKCAVRHEVFGFFCQAPFWDV